MLFAVAGAYAVFACTYEPALWATRWWAPLLTGVIIGIVGTYGDLCASMLKRDMGIKDMGHMLKGHRSCGFDPHVRAIHMRIAVGNWTVDE